MRVAILIPVLAVLVGAVPGLHTAAPAAFWTCALLAGTGSALVAWWTSRGRTMVVMSGVAFLAGTARLSACIERELLFPPLFAGLGELIAPGGEAEPIVLSGRLVEDAAPTAYGASLLLDVETVDARKGVRATRGRVRLGVGGSQVAARIGRWRAGRRIRAPATLRRALPYLNPGVPDQEHALALRGVRLLGSVKSAALVEVVANGSRTEEAAAALRAYVRRSVERACGGHHQAAAVIIAILIGDRAGLSTELEDRLQRAGTYHVIAISGGNIALLLGLLLVCARLARLPPRAGTLATALALHGFAATALAQPSVLRATLVAMVYLTGRLWDLKGAATAPLAVVAALLVIRSPPSLRDPGFQLTFAASLAILVGVPRLVTWWLSLERSETDVRRVAGRRGGIRRLLTAAGGLTAASASVELAIWPIAAVAFARVTSAGLLLNLAAVPLMAVAQIGGLLLVGIAWLSPFGARLAAIPARAGVDGLIESARLVDAAPWLARRVPPPGWLPVGVYYASLIGLVLARPWRIRRVAWSALAAAAAWMIASPAGATWPRPPREPVSHTAGGGRPGRVTPCAPARRNLSAPLVRAMFLDVGQGDATVIQARESGWVLVDAGGRPAAGTFDIGERIVSRALWRVGARRLELLAITHGDPDHVGGAPAVVDAFRPRVVWEGVPVPGHAPLADLARLVARTGGTWTTRRAGDRVVWPDCEVRVLHPPPPDWERRRVRNDDSLVIEWRAGGLSIVLPGDIGRGPEAALASAFERSPMRILKVPHHGSRTSSSEAFVRALDPVIAVVSAARGNAYGHPAHAVLETYSARGTTVFRTDRDGAVLLESDGQRTRVWGWGSGRCVETTAGKAGGT